MVAVGGAFFGDFLCLRRKDWAQEELTRTAGFQKGQGEKTPYLDL